MNFTQSFNRSTARAFRPFFDARVGVEAQRCGMTYRGTYAACVFPADAMEPLTDVSFEAEGERVTILIAKVGPLAWNQPDPPRVGDIITHEGKRYAVTKRDEFVTDCYQLEARQA